MHASNLVLYWYVTNLVIHENFSNLFQHDMFLAAMKLLLNEVQQVPLNPAFNATQVIAALNHLTVSNLILGWETNLPFKSPRSNIPLLDQIVIDRKSAKLESEILPVRFLPYSNLRLLQLTNSVHTRFSRLVN